MIMRNLNGIWIILVLCGIVAATAVSFFAPVCFADDDSDAKREFENMTAVQISDPGVLDQFIKKYPNTEQARLAFVYRYTLLASSPSIDGYNEFIEKYSDKDIAPIAIHEVYQLYRDQNRAAGYFDFVARYPGSQQAMVATMKLQELFFEYVCLLDTEQDYDDFIRLFPNAPQVNAAKFKAMQKAIETERKEFEAFKKTNPSRDEVFDHVSVKIAAFTSKITRFIDKYKNIDTSVNFDKKFEIFAEHTKIIRQSEALKKAYAAYDHSGRVEHAVMSLSVIQRLDMILNVIEINHKELLAKMDEETDRICEGLALLHKDNQEIITTLREGFKTLHQDMVTVHQELKEINMQLVKVNANLEQLRHDINVNFDRLDKKLDVINENLIKVQQAVTESAMATNQVLREEFAGMNKNIETGFNRQAVMLDKMNQTMIKGFDETNRQLFGMGQKIDKLDQDMVDGMGHIQSSLVNIGGKLDNINQNMQAGFAGLSEQLNVLDNHLVTGLADVGNKIENMDAHMQAGMSALNSNISGMRQEMREGFNNVCETVVAATESVNQSLSAIHYDINEVNKSVQQVNRNVIAGNEMIGSMHRDMVQGFRNQESISRAILHENQMQSSQLNQIKNIAYSGFNNINKKLDSQIALQQSANAMLNTLQTAQQAMPAFTSNGIDIMGLLNQSGKIPAIDDMLEQLKGGALGDLKGKLPDSITDLLKSGMSSGGSKTKAVSNVAGAAFGAYVGTFCPAAAPIASKVGSKVTGAAIKGVKKIRKKLFGSIDGFDYYIYEDDPSQIVIISNDESVVMAFHENYYKVLLTAYQEADEEDDAEAKEALLKMIFQEDKRRVLNAAVQLASFKRPYPVFPENLKDLVLNARNADELQEAIIPLAIYCGVTPEALNYAAQYIY